MCLFFLIYSICKMNECLDFFYIFFCIKFFMKVKVMLCVEFKYWKDVFF